MTMVSLIVSTLGRVQELEGLLASLDRQTCKNFEVLVVDQNCDDRLCPILTAHPGLLIRHLRSGRGLSRGRNTALPLAKGDIICFPDDDCWYPEDLLSSVVTWFDGHPEFAGLFALLRDGDGNPVGPKLPIRACRCTKRSILTIAASPAGFLRKQIADAIGLFNENIGVGSDSTYQAGEECDYFLRPLELGYDMWFEPAFTVHHPNLHSPGRLRRTTYRYALGGTYVLRVHGYSLLYPANLVFRSLGGAALSLLKFDFENAYIYLLRAAGYIRGYVWGPRDLARLQSRQG